MVMELKPDEPELEPELLEPEGEEEEEEEEEDDICGCIVARWDIMIVLQ